MRDEVYLNKPPLYFWLVAVFALPFGAVTDATAPIASVLSALMGLLGVFAIGRRLWDDDTGLAATAVLATSPFYFFMAHQVLTDMMLTAWMTW
ncbi:MAG TPA: glycosyltransferase family 39 protein, partial [Verrucomicrobiae bacterium]|nr:glycosyltransferase family 39 protein [Verrucomicrobiae bacterium]